MLRSLFFPHKKNDHRPPALRHYSIFPLVTAFILFQVNLTLFGSSNPQILSFATSIYQQDFFKLVNEERSQVAVHALVENSSLNRAAQLKAQHMFNEDYWAHVAPDGTTPWDFFQQVEYDYRYAGENLAKDFNTSAGVVAGWMGSPSHRANLLNSNFNEMGIAVVNGVLLGEETTLVVQLFGTPINAVATTQTTSALAVSDPIPTVIPTNAPASAEVPVPATVPAQIEDEQPVAQPEEYVSPREDTVVFYPESVYTSIYEEKAYKPQGISAQLYTGWQNLEDTARIVLSPTSWSNGQQVAVLFFAGLILLLLGDSIMLWRQGIKRNNSHSLMHAGIVSILLIITILNGAGAIL
ncbi:CAP domain-containing protein [Patescibacteria group bacterium]|nr:CAP domain-containing protein [Patescibacteria group bacterium]